jgi:hypothetical protein
VDGSVGIPAQHLVAVGHPAQVVALAATLPDLLEQLLLELRAEPAAVAFCPSLSDMEEAVVLLPFLLGGLWRVVVGQGALSGLRLGLTAPHSHATGCLNLQPPALGGTADGYGLAPGLELHHVADAVVVA